MKPNVRCGLTAEGNIEAALDMRYRLVCDVCTGNVIEKTAAVKEGTDIFRWLVQAARKHCNLH